MHSCFSFGGRAEDRMEKLLVVALLSSAALEGDNRRRANISTLSTSAARLHSYGQVRRYGRHR